LQQQQSTHGTDHRGCGFWFRHLRRRRAHLWKAGLLGGAAIPHTSKTRRRRQGWALLSHIGSRLAVL
jgi:hypothetical protein